MNIQSTDKFEVFWKDLPDKFSFNEYSYKQFEIDLDKIENKMTELLLKNRKLFDNSINSFVYTNEDLTYENKNIIITF